MRLVAERGSDEQEREIGDEECKCPLNKKGNEREEGRRRKGIRVTAGKFSGQWFVGFYGGESKSGLVKE